MPNLSGPETRECIRFKPVFHPFDFRTASTGNVIDTGPVGILTEEIRPYTLPEFGVYRRPRQFSAGFSSSENHPRQPAKTSHPEV